MAHSYQLKRNFKVGEVVYIPEYGEKLPLENGTSTKFVVKSVSIDGNTDKGTELIVTCEHASETLVLSVMATKVYKVAPSCICAHCGHEVCYEADKEVSKEYPYYCPDCDENMYGLEIVVI